MSAYLGIITIELDPGNLAELGKCGLNREDEKT
jgi:hypothetical protein